MSTGFWLLASPRVHPRAQLILREQVSLSGGRATDLDMPAAAHFLSLEDLFLESGKGWCTSALFRVPVQGEGLCRTGSRR